MEAYSLDLRRKVLAGALGGDRSIREVYELFGVGASFVNKLLDLHRAGEDLTPRRTAAWRRTLQSKTTRGESYSGGNRMCKGYWPNRWRRDIRRQR
jgi:transposase